MTYRVSRSASNYELQNDHPNGGSEPYLHHYVHNPAQSASVANIQQLATLQVSVISVVEFQGAELIICKLLKSRILISSLQKVKKKCSFFFSFSNSSHKTGYL